MSKEQKELLLIKKKIKEWIIKNNVVDVLIFGSIARSKTMPNDLDLCILIKDEDEKIAIDLIDSLSKVVDKLSFKTQINFLTEKKFIFGSTLTKTLITEGISILNNKKVAELLGFVSKSLFIYSLKNFSSSKRVRFHYLLRGRKGEKGILDEVEGKIMGDGVIEAPTEKEDLLKEIFETWEVKYKINRILLA